MFLDYFISVTSSDSVTTQWEQTVRIDVKHTEYNFVQQISSTVHFPLQSRSTLSAGALCGHYSSVIREMRLISTLTQRMDYSPRGKVIHILWPVLVTSNSLHYWNQLTFTSNYVWTGAVISLITGAIILHSRCWRWTGAWTESWWNKHNQPITQPVGQRGWKCFFQAIVFLSVPFVVFKIYVQPVKSEFVHDFGIGPYVPCLVFVIKW